MEKKKILISKEEESRIREIIKDLKIGNTSKAIKYFEEKLPKKVKQSKEQKDFKKRNEIIQEYRRELIQKITPAEKNVFAYLTKRDIPFKFQHPIIVSTNQFYLVDFYFEKKRLAVEIDGGYHFTDEQERRDANRTRNLGLCNVRVVRFTNEETEDESKFMKTLELLLK
jgi:very-short-patch-repair endonuclease